MTNKQTFHLPKGQSVNITTNFHTTGSYVRLGGTYTPTALTTSADVTVGPFNEPRDYAIYTTGALASYTLSESGEFTKTDDDRVLTLEAYTTTDNVGTAATNVTATEYGDAYQHTTVLTVTNAVLPAITGGAAESEGVLLYTLPAGACVVKQAYMSLAIQQQDGNITADTPDVGLGTTIGSGANATLSAVDAAAENILTGQTAADCDGTATVKTVGGQVLEVETGGDHTVYFNVADTWAASGDTGALVSGTVVLHWQFMA